MIDRLFGGYPDLAYAGALHAGALPPNIKVIEFFFLAGRWLHVPFAQQHYISANYTHAASYICWRAGSTSSRNWWRSASSMASRATA